MDLEKFLQAKDSDFSKNDRKIYQYIKEYPKRAKLMTINKLANETNTSIAAIQRFCTKIGFTGFKEFKFSLGQVINRYQDNSDKTVTWIEDYLSVIEQMRSVDLDTLIASIQKSRAILTTGIYYSSIPAKQLQMALTDLGYLSEFAEGYTSIPHLFNVATPKDTLIHFSITGDTSKEFMQKLAKEFKDNCNTFLVTLNEQTKTREYFEHTIILPGSAFAHHTTIDPQSIFCMFVELLINQLDESNSKKNSRK